MDAQRTTGAQTRRALYALSADPITLGHIDIVERVSQRFEQVIVGVGCNPAKSYLFSLDQRLALARSVLAHIPNVEVTAYQGLVVDFALQRGIGVIIKGVRNGEDFRYEQLLHQVGSSQVSGIDTHVLFSGASLSHVSSSVAKGIQLEHGDLSGYVPLPVKAALEARISDQIIIGVTGEIAAGKSTFCKAMVRMGEASEVAVHHIEVDVLGHQVLDDRHSELGNRVRDDALDLLGSEILRDGCLDRARIADKVFGDTALLRRFSQLMEQPIALQLRQALRGKRGVILLESALLAEADMLKVCNNRVVLLENDASEQASRLADRGYTPEHASARSGTQYAAERKRREIETAIQDTGFGQLWRVPSLQWDDTSLGELISSFGQLQAPAGDVAS